MTKYADQHTLFPVQLHANWRDAQSFSLPEHLRDWLLEPSSLTARLKQHCREFRVEVLGQQVLPCPVDEATAEVAVDQDVLVREVILYCDQQPSVFARSLLPLSSLTGDAQQLANLGEQPLGQVIFTHPNLVRKRIEVASFDEASTVASLAKHCQLPVSSPLWGRRSIFMLADKPLIVSEVFLPHAAAYNAKSMN
ncbi:chorismate lyase [Thalassotalea sp. G2M2-11]|uniref:chorismate--pyruvate lyase family protein n=1 Tax=Thalassotalea sp. G2M2-11 TaxID=2787627 RepID=UPI0019D2619C|nr:chorismate lyase [Thalassotalea sp. G2M2-11]